MRLGRYAKNKPKVYTDTIIFHNLLWNVLLLTFQDVSYSEVVKKEVIKEKMVILYSTDTLARDKSSQLHIINFIQQSKVPWLGIPFGHFSRGGLMEVLAPNTPR